MLSKAVWAAVRIKIISGDGFRLRPVCNGGGFFASRVSHRSCSLRRDSRLALEQLRLPDGGGATVFADARAKAGNRVRTSQRLAFSGAFGLSGSGSFFCELDAKGFERGAEVDFLLAAEGVGLLRAKGTALCTRLRAVRETADLGRAFDPSACPARAQSSANR